MDEEAYRMVALRLLPLLLNDKAIYYRDFEVGPKDAQIVEKDLPPFIACILGESRFALVAEKEIVLDSIDSFSRAFYLFFALSYAMDLEYVSPKTFKVIECHIMQMDSGVNMPQVVKKFRSKVLSAIAKL